MNKYEVRCKCGHVGKNRYIEIAFPIIAKNAKEASTVARNFPRVKHDHKDAIISVKTINDEQYTALIELNRNDEYLRCKCIQDQNYIDLSGRVKYEQQEEDEEPLMEENIMHFFKKKLIKNPKRFFKDISNYDSYDEVYAW